MARPTKLTPEIQKKICDALNAGNYFEVACEYAGIDKSTGYQWMARGQGRAKNRPANAEFVEFVDAVQKATTDAEVRTVANWQKAIPEDWRAAKDFLARRYPKRWQERKTINLGDLTNEQIIAALEADVAGGSEAEGD
jgi:transposase